MLKLSVPAVKAVVPSDEMITGAEADPRVVEDVIPVPKLEAM